MARRKRGADRRLRAPLRSPRRPGVAKREDRRRFWLAIAVGRSSEDAAKHGGVSQSVGSRWFREAGGMPPSHLAPSAPLPSGRYLSFAEREEIALLNVQGHGVQEIARRIERARRCRGSCAATRPRAPAPWFIAPPRRNGMPSARRDGRRRRSSHRTPPCGATSRTAWLGGSYILTASRSKDHERCGESVVTAPGRCAVGRGPGAGLGPAQDRLPRGRYDARQPRGDRSVPLHPRPRCAAT